MSERYDICVIGLGYIGLPTASIFATKGKKVLGVDVVPEVVDSVNQGLIHIEEPDLDVLVRAAVQSGNLKAATQPAEADVYIIAVPTPFAAADGEMYTPDLSYVEAATHSIAPHVNPDALVVLESTSPVGTTERVRDWLQAALVDANQPEADQPDGFPLSFAYCPERILPGQMLKELVANDRIVGGLSPEASERARELYLTFCSAEILISDARTAEMVKLTENSFRDVNIAFANELSMVCDKLDINVWELIRLANRHPRVGVLQPGPGVGGHCIAVDPWFLASAAPEQTRLIQSARHVNDAKPGHVADQVMAKAQSLREPVIACLGLAFKANVDDLRESPAVEIVETLLQRECGEILVVEPHTDALPRQLACFDNVKLTSLREALTAANMVVLLVDHQPFLRVPSAALMEKIVIDTRGVWQLPPHDPTT